MRYLLLILLSIGLFFSCSTHKKITNNENTTTVKDSFNDGSSYEKAIVIQEKSETTGVDAEYKWIRIYYPGCKIKGQSLSFHQNKPYDIIDITTSDGKDVSIHFDISNFYGKF